MGMFWRGKGPWNHKAGVSRNKGLCGFVCSSRSTTAEQAQIAHACNLSLCHASLLRCVRPPLFFYAAPWKIFWLDGLFLSRNLAETINLQRTNPGFLWSWVQTQENMRVFRVHPSRLKAEVAKTKKKNPTTTVCHVVQMVDIFTGCWICFLYIYYNLRMSMKKTYIFETHCKLSWKDFIFTFKRHFGVTLLVTLCAAARGRLVSHITAPR